MAKIRSKKVSQKGLTGLCMGGRLADEICRVAALLPSVSRNALLLYRSTGLSQNISAIGANHPSETNLLFCWYQATNSSEGMIAPTDRAVVASCPSIVFPTLQLSSLWPYLDHSNSALAGNNHDPAAKPFHNGGRRFLDAPNILSDAVCPVSRPYDTSVSSGLDRLIEYDFCRFRMADACSSIQLFPFIRRNFKKARLFLSPFAPGPVLIRELVFQLICSTPDVLQVDVETLNAELDFLMEGYVGLREELPIDPYVAAHFQLEWWSPSMEYRWGGTRRTFVDHHIGYAQLSPERP